MANGKGTLDCIYCVRFDRSQDRSNPPYEKDRCNFHEVLLPRSKADHHNRICCNFEPNETYCKHNTQPEFMPLARRFAWFGIDMKPGVLYEFPYNQPEDITETEVLRIPDYQNGRWKSVAR